MKILGPGLNVFSEKPGIMYKPFVSKNFKDALTSVFMRYVPLKIDAWSPTELEKELWIVEAGRIRIHQSEE